VRIARFPRGADAAEIRALSRPAAAVEGEVRAILDEVRAGGDEAVSRLTARFDHAEVAPERLRVPEEEIERALGLLEPVVLAALDTARVNVGQVARAQLHDDVAIELAEGHRVEVAEVPVRRVGVYVPGGRAPYASTVVMAAETARAAGVDEVAVCAPPGPGGQGHPVILAACGLCGVLEVYRMGGAQAIAAMAYGTDSVRPTDVIVGPGNAWVQEAKRQVAGAVGIDSLAGPSELVVVAAGDAEPELVAFDLLAQAEHGPDSLLVLISEDSAVLERVAREVERLTASGARPSVADAPLALVAVPDPRAGVDLAEAIAPEHLELVGAGAEAHAPRVRSAGCLFVGRDAATAFGDYVAGSNHVLPTGGAARFQSALGVGIFRRRMARVSLSPGAAARLSPAGVALADAEGFPVHGESMARRA
jgi:histidinol dehydrogenase